MSELEQTRIAKLERQVESLKEAIRELALILNAEPELRVDYVRALKLDD